MPFLRLKGYPSPGWQGNRADGAKPGQAEQTLNGNRAKRPALAKRFILTVQLLFLTLFFFVPGCQQIPVLPDGNGEVQETGEEEPAPPLPQDEEESVPAAEPELPLPPSPPAPSLPAPADPGQPSEQEGESETEAGSTAEESEESPYLDGDDLLAPVSKETWLSPDYEPLDLAPIPPEISPSGERLLRLEALAHLEEMWQDARADGVKLEVLSAYRSYATQERIFTRNVARRGEEEANRSSARPGQSEHQLGTTIDFGGTAADWSASFGETSAGRWLAENAYRYGFAMSYPPDSEEITGYIYEPWHYRYIGREHARRWRESGLILTEYIQVHRGR